MATTAADLLIDRLIDWGVDTLFGFPGDGVNGLFEALRTRQYKIRFVQVRHEEAAAFAACGYAKFSGKPGFCIATSGPGGIHLLNGLYDAKCDGVPVVAITGHTFHDLIGTHYQQDVDLTKLFMDVSVYNERITGPSHVHNALDEAIRTAVARRGVAHVCIPKDVQDWTSSNGHASSGNVKRHSADYVPAPPLLPSDEDLRAAASLINSGKKVAVLAGRGCMQAGKQVEQLAEKVGGPIIKALLGKAVVPDDSPYTTGGLGLLGTAPSQDATRGCDTFLILGSSFPYMEFLPRPGQARCVQVDVDPARIGLRYPCDIGLVGDCRRILDALLPMIEQKTDRRFLEAAQSNMAKWRKVLEERANRTDKPMKPQVVAHRLNKFLADDAIVVSDCGTVTTWAARYVTMREKMLFSASGLLATMANGLPYSVGAAFAHPGRQVVCLSGDGGFTMLMGELATMVKYKLPVKVIIIKNNVLGQIKWEQMVMEGNPQFGVELHPIDFAAFARSVGAAGFSVDDPAKVDAVLGQAFAHDGPAVVEATVDPNEPAMPGHVTMDQAVGFAESILRGQKNGLQIAGTALAEKIREVI
jgi:pyruvate dehydrogenase (quinone)